MNARRRKFAHEYVRNGFNGVQAIFAAGYKMGYNAACVEASRLLRNPKVRASVEEHLQASKISADEVLEELSKLARAPVPKEVSEAGKLKALELSGKVHKLFTDKVETLNSEDSTAKLTISKVISATSKRESRSLSEVEYELQSRFADKSAEDYDAALDPSVNPQQWPSGNLLQKPLESQANN